MTAAALLLRHLKFSGQKRSDETTLSEEQSLWKARILVPRALDIPVTTRFLSLESFSVLQGPTACGHEEKKNL